MKEFVLTGLDGTNPLAFLATLGAFRVLSRNEPSWRLRWREDGRWVPVLDGPDGAAPVAELARDVKRWSSVATPALQLTYKKGKRTLREIKPPPNIFRDFLMDAAKAAVADNGEFAGEFAGELAEFAAAYATQFAQDNRGQTKPTALHFTAGQQLFLEIAAELADGITRDHLDEALFGPWRYKGQLKTLRWDVTDDRQRALLSHNPQKVTKQGVPGADWLAFQALPIFPVFPVMKGTRAMVVTTGFVDKRRGYSDQCFQWPIWTVPTSIDAVRSLLAQRTEPDKQAVRGIAAVFESRVRRSEQGYGNFQPARLV